MRVLYFHQHFSTPQGSAGTRSYEMAKRLVARGHRVTMVCGRYLGGVTGLTGPFRHGRRCGNVEGIDVIEFDIAYANKDGLPKRMWLFLAFALRSIGLGLFSRYDVIFATTTPLTAGIPGIFARWLRGKPFVFEVRDLWPELPRAMGVIRNRAVLAALSLLEFASYRSAHRLIGLAPGIVDGIAARGVPRDRIALVPNGCDLDLFGEAAAWRPEGVAPGDLLAGFTGTHGVANGLDAVLDAAAELKRRGRRDIHLLLVGDGKRKPALEARAAREQLDNVLFLAPMDKVRLAGLMAGMDLGLQILANVPAFYFGTSPNKFFDYIAGGLPVLNNYPGWLAEIIGTQECGFSVPPGDAGAFADALERAADDRDALRRMSQRARAVASNEFDRALLAERLVDQIEAAITPGKPNASA